MPETPLEAENLPETQEKSFFPVLKLNSKHKVA